MVFRIEKGLMVILAVDIGKGPAQAAELSQCYNIVVYAAYVLSGGGYFPGNNVFLVQVVEDHLHGGLLTAGAYKSGVGSASKSQTDSLYHYGFSRPCFACYNIEPVVKLYFGIFYYGEIFYSYVAYHRLPLKHVIEKLHNNRGVLGIIDYKHNGVVSCHRSYYMGKAYGVKGLGGRSGAP